MVAPYAAGSSSAAGGLGAGASHTGYQHARTPQRGDQAANLCRAHLPQLRRLSTPRSSPCRRNSRELARGPPLPQYERSQGAQENLIPPSRIDQPKMTAFAELDAHNRPPPDDAIVHLAKPQRPRAREDQSNRAFPSMPASSQP